MNKIIFPLQAPMSGPSVGDLQVALQFLIDQGKLYKGGGLELQALVALLKAEREIKLYGPGTIALVLRFQTEQRLSQNSMVDEPTAKAINSILGLDRTTYVVSGRVMRSDQQPFSGMVRAFHVDDAHGVVRLGDDTVTMGDYTIRYELLPGVDGINLRVSVMGDNGELLQSSEVKNNAKPLEIINLTVPIVSKPATQRRIEGQIMLQHGLLPEQLKLRLYRLDFGGKTTMLGETTTLSDGQYAFAYDPGGKAVSLEVRAVNDANEEIPLSKPLNDLSGESRMELNLVAPAALKPLAAEYRRLSEDLMPHVGQMTKLADAKENDKDQDLTKLNRATGWDARLIALAAITERLNADAEVKLPQEALYGLLRAGLPSDKLMLAQVDADVAEQALKTVRNAGIIELNDQQIGDFKNQFATFATAVRLNIPSPGSRSTYGDLLGGSGLSGTAQNKFAPVYLSHQGDATQLWDKAREAGLDDGEIGQLQLHGKLAFLAGNSDRITTHLMQRITDLAQLVEQDFHQTDSWVMDILDLAEIPLDRRNNLTDVDRANLDALIPAAYGGGKTEDRLASYAEDMARKVRLSYPTQVVGRMVKQDEIKLPEARDATVTLMKNAAGQGFRLGETPVEVFLRNHAGVRDGMADTEFHAAQQQMKTLQRVYQITPSNEAMPVLMQLGMTSAYDVMAYPETQFVALFEAKYFELYKKPTPAGVAVMVSRKAKQVSSVTYNLFTIAKKLDSEPPVAVMSAPVEVRESVRNELIKQFPTMESLFGSMDFCECEHCRSVLSPAAYLVDLLQFVDAEPGVWGNFLAQWKATHGGLDYTAKYKKPYDALIERRPDLPHIPLTCENTHTALPYIDIVNEILEYYVANGKLEEKAAHDTGEATTAELLAEPQNVIRGAYDKLREARYPMNLPFDLWIETVRQFCNYFETPLARVLEVFRPNDDLFAPTQPFDRFAVFMESLGLSLAEVAIFTDPDPLAKWYELYGFKTAAEATTKATDATTGQRIDLNSAKALSRRLGITYKEIAEIVQTGFVNAKLVKLGVLYKLGVSIHDARFYLDHKNDPAPVSAEEQKRQLEVQAFTQEIAKLAEAFQMTTAQLEVELQAIPFDKILVLADPDAGCNFDLTTLQYADGAKADPIAFLRINLFVRLWRKLSWSIEETDRALSTFIPKSVPYDKEPANLARQPLRSALIYLAHLKALDEMVKVGKQSRLKLITLWSDIATTGKNSLYAQLFLTRSVLKSDPVFDHPLGQYLSATGVKLTDHVLALQGALGLTADEIRHILVDAEKSFETAELSLVNVSLLYRYGLLAKALKLSVRELITLKQLSGLNPFTQLHPDPLADTPAGVVPPKKAIEFDYPFSQTLRFVEVAEEVKDSGLKIEDLEYLLRHRFDETGQYRPNPEGTLALLKTLAEGVRAIRAEHALPDDPGTLSDEVLRQKLGLALTSDVVERFLAMMNGTAEFTVTRSVASAGQLHPADFRGEPSITLLPYNSTKNEQTLVCRGVLFDAQKTTLKAKFGGNLPVEQKATFEALLDDAQTNAQLQGHAFFGKHLLKQGPGIQPVSGFLDAADYDLLFASGSDDLTEAQQQAREKQQRTRLAKAFLPFLQQRLIRQFIIQTMTAQTAADPVLVESLITDKRLLTGMDSMPLLASFTSTGERGVSAAFFDSNDGSGLPQATTRIVRSADTSLKDNKDTNGNPLTSAKSARFEGYLEVPTPGAYRFYIELDQQNAKAELRFNQLANPVFLKDTATAANSGKFDNFLELKAGVLYCFSLDLKELNGGEARLLVQGETLPKGPMSQLTLYPAAAIDAAERAVLLLTKTLQLAQGLGLSEREIRYLLTHAADFGGIDLSQLPTRSRDDTPTEKMAATERFAQFLRLAAYAHLKRDLAGGTDDLIGVFEANEIKDAGKLDKKVYLLIAQLTRRDETTVKACAKALFALPAFESEQPMQRLWEVLRVVERFGVPVTSLLEWTRIVGTVATPEQRFEIARDLKEAIRARFEPETWQRVAQPIFDKLRQRQRDALVAHVMHQHGFASMEQLYEYFLIDPGMEPVVQTSRIRLAIASLQLFIQRCLLNMELQVHPSVINSKQWEWMKRYRVWEANRKIFLFPENWLEPEFRDDKTHLFAELEGALLQGDVSSDLVEDAFLNYLKKLDELARLDIVAMHLEDNADPAKRILHVIGRTYSQPHKYFYRRYAHQMWTAWEPVSAEIEGDHLAPVVWRDRLYLFWVTFMEKAREDTNSTITIREMAEKTVSACVKKEVEVQLHWSEYLEGNWSTRESGGFSTSLKGSIDDAFDPKSMFIHVAKGPYENGEERGVYIHLGGAIKQAFYLAGRNSAPEIKGYGAASNGPTPDNPYSSANVPLANRYSGSGELKVSFQEQITTEAGKTPPKANPSILQQGGGYTLLPCDNNLTALGVSEDAYLNAANPDAVKAAIKRGLEEIASLMKPVFYQDNAHTLFVEPSVTERTIEEWQDWVTRTPQPEPDWRIPDWWREIVVLPKIPIKWPIPDSREPRWGFPIDPGSLLNPRLDSDWLVNPGTGLMFDGVLIGPAGQPGLEILTAEGAGAMVDKGTPVNVNPGSGLASGSTVVLTGATTLEQNGLTLVAGGLNIVGGSGFNSALTQNFNESIRSGFGAGMPGAGRAGR